MKVAKDFTNKKFGRWTVISFAGKRGKVPYWLCECACGTKQEVCLWNLTSNKTISCGCYHRELLFHDLTDKIFGRLRVLQYAGKHANNKDSMWLCQCECFNQKVISANSLISGATQSCGCYHREKVGKDITGQEFGKLTALTRLEKKASNGSYYWQCICSCGTFKIVASKHLLSNSVTSCGCNLRTRDGLSQTKEMRSFYSKVRRDRKYIYDTVWTLEMEKSLIEFQDSCVLCNTTDDLTIDHVKPLSRGYGLEPGNAVILCGNCNSKKIDKQLDDLPIRIRQVLFQSAKEFLYHWQETRQSLLNFTWS